MYFFWHFSHLKWFSTAPGVEEPGETSLSREEPTSGLVTDTGVDFLSEVGADLDRATMSQVGTGTDKSSLCTMGEKTGGGVSLSGVGVVTAVDTP